MIVQQIIILLLLIIEALSAPSGCIESCSSYFNSNFQDHVKQSAIPLQGLDYSRPGTWSEHNNYNVDNGHGNVHEERGQYIEGPKTVRYYKKNYTSSYSTRYSNGEGLANVEHQNNNHRHGILVPNTEEISSQRTYNQIGTERYNAMQSSIRSGARSERLEDFGEYTRNSQALQQGLSDSNAQFLQTPYYTSTQPGNWSKVDSYKTDGGHGHVFEEEGQYLSGANKVRYYKKNYTSSYSSYGGIPEIDKTRVQDIQKEINKFHKEIGQKLSLTSSVENIGSSDTVPTNVNTYDSSNTHNINTNKYRSQNNYESRSSTTRHNEEQQLRGSTSKHLSTKSPFQNPYEANSYSVYEKHEGHVTKFQPITQFINPASDYTHVLNTGNSGYNRNTINTGISQQYMDNIQETGHLDRHDLKLNQDETFSDNVRNNRHNQHGAIHSGALGQTAHYKEHWSASHTKEASVPQYSVDISHTHGMHEGLQQDSYLNHLREKNVNTAQRTQLGKLVTGTIDLSQIGDTVDCAYDSQHIHSSSQHQTKYKRSIKFDQDSEPEQVTIRDLIQKVKHKDLLQPISQFGQQTQQLNQLWNSDSGNQHSRNLAQQNKHNHFTQQTSGKLEFGQESQQSYQPQKPGNANPYSQDLTQHSNDHDDLTQQTSGKLEFGQESQQSYQPRKPGNANPYSQDLTQQSNDHDDLTQQTSGKLEFGQESQQSYEPWKFDNANPYSQDLTEQSNDHDDLTQQTSGKLEFGQESQQSYQPRKPGNANLYSQDLTQQSNDHDDLTQQTSGKLEFGQESQQSYQPRKPGNANPYSQDLTQQSNDHDDLTQQTSGKLEFGQETQQSYEPWKFDNANPYSQDLTQQSNDHDDLTQQTSGKLEFGQETQQSYEPWKFDNANPYSQDLTQQSNDHDDLTQQTSGKLEFGQESQQSYEPWKFDKANPYSQDLTQQSNDHDDLTQQTSGKLEFGQESQQSYEPWKSDNAKPYSQDLTQQSNDHDDLTQQISGKLEFGQELQQSYQPRKPGNANPYSQDLMQQSNNHDDLTQQTSGKLEFGQESQQSYEPWKFDNANPYSQDVTQQSNDHDDLTQQTSGKLEFGQESQQSYEPWKSDNANPYSQDLTQQSNNHDDLTQQTSGKLEFGQESQQSYEPWKFDNANPYSQDLTQQSNDHDDLTQQTSGKLEFGQESQQSYQPWKPNSANQHLEDLTQQPSGHESVTQQISGNLELGQEWLQSHQLWSPESANQHSVNSVQQSQDDIYKNEQRSSIHISKPAEKPKPRPRYLRVGSVGKIQDQNMYDANNEKLVNHNDEDTYIPTIHELPPYVETEGDVDNIKNQNIRGDQIPQNSNKNISKDLNQQTAVDAYDIEREDVDQVNWLHKSNDATVGLQWHYTYHPSDQRQFVQQTDQKNKEKSQQQLSHTKFSDLQKSSEQQETQGNIEERNPLIVNQQASEVETQQKQIRSSETKHQLEPRILEAYGGGPYDVSHSDDIYYGITVNPSVTLPPINSADPWDVREKPKETDVTEIIPPPMPVEPLVTSTDDASTPSPNFWARLGHKITNTFDKAKERARNIFG